MPRRNCQENTRKEEKKTAFAVFLWAEKKGFALACGLGQGAGKHATGMFSYTRPFKSPFNRKNKAPPFGGTLFFGGEEGI